MKKFVVAAAMIAATSFGAAAADLRLKAPMAPLSPAPVSTWTGFYAGVNVGGSWGTSKQTLDVTSGGDFFSAPVCFPPISTCVVNTVDVQRAGAQSLDSSAFVGGIQFGYNWQRGAIVYGVEADISSFGHSKSGLVTVPIVSGAPGTVSVGESIATDWLATLRARLGWVVNPNWMVYATGGLAITDLDAKWLYFDSFWGNAAVGGVSDTKWGWTLGFGAEMKLGAFPGIAAFGGGWTLGLEYLYVNFDDISATVPVVLPSGGGPTPQNFTYKADFDAHIVRARLNKFF